MNRIFNLVLMSTVVLAAVACQKERQENDTPEDGVKEVTTQFVLNIAAAPTTKMSAAAVQQANNFRGIQDAKLFTYKSGVTSGTPYVLSTNATTEKFYDFGSLMADGSLNNSSTGTNEANNVTGDNPTASKRVLQLSVPIGVDAVMFYGRATKTAGLSSFEYGATDALATTISGTPNSTVFAAQKILSSDSATKYDATARLMIAVINDLLSAQVSATTDPTYGYLPAVSWAQYGHRYEYDHSPSTPRYPLSLALDHPLEGLEEVLGKCYYLFTYILPASTPTRPHGEYRAGSSRAVSQMAMDMYKVISAASSATPTTANELNALRIAELVLDRTLLYFNVDPTDDIPDGSYNSISKLKGLLVDSYHVYSEPDWTTKFSGAQDLNGYPFEDFGVPEGAAQLGFNCQEEGKADSKDEFYYHHPNFPLVNPTMSNFDPLKYFYPAELWYYVNSPIRTTSTDVTAGSYPDGVTPWNTASSWTGWVSPGKVEGSTRGVAVTNSINYGVAMLKTSVVFKDPSLPLQDNRAALTNNVEPNKSITPTASLFELRGVLVGGVIPKVDWQFLRKDASDDYTNVIYDHSLESNAVPTTMPNYTLVYDNCVPSETQANQRDVYVSLEFVNKGESFYGRDNLIPSGGVFYLVAKLEKPSADQITALASKWPTDHQIPPVWGVDGETVTSPAVAGESKKIARVFIQDFVTSATFKIGPTSLQNAYYSVPDLRASQMSLGLSVDLQWIPGLEYELDL